jgi:hypothetical protein
MKTIPRIPAAPHEFFEGLKRLIPNMPAEGVTGLDIRLRHNEIPTMTVTLEPRIVGDDVPLLQTFKIEKL